MMQTYFSASLPAGQSLPASADSVLLMNVFLAVLSSVLYYPVEESLVAASEFTKCWKT